MHQQKLSNYFLGYLIAHLRHCFNVLGNLWRAPLASLLIIIVVAITLALPTVLFIACQNITAIANDLYQHKQMNVFIHHTAAEHEIIALTAQLTANPLIDKVIYQTPDAALQEIQTSLGGLAPSATNPAIELLDNNPLPITLIIHLASNTTTLAAQQLYTKLQQHSIVESITLDLDWLEKINTLLALLRHCIILSFAILSTAVILIIANVARMAIENNRTNIVIAQMIGATNAFIRREFLYLGFWYGCLGSLLTILFACVITRLFATKITDLASTLLPNAQFVNLGFHQGCVLVAFGSGLGVISAWLSVSYQMKKLHL